MPSILHEIAVARLSRDPSLLPALAEKLLGRPPPPVLRPVDSVLRLANPEELRPDLVLADGERGPWDAVEVQRRLDRAKARRWPLLVSLLHDQRHCMGDLWVLTASRRTAAWARTVCDTAGPSGTRMRLSPVVLLLGPDQVDALLDEGRPSLAFFAAWAMQSRRDPAAVQVIERALAITDRLPNRLRRRQERDIVSVLNRSIVEKLKERMMAPTKNLESRWVRELREELSAIARVEGKAEGKRDAVLVVLKSRALPLSEGQRAAILGCSDAATLDRWLAGCWKVASVDELFSPVTAPKKSPNHPTAPRSATTKRAERLAAARHPRSSASSSRATS